MLPLVLYYAAEDELADAILFYEDREAGLGTSLRLSVETTLESIQEHPYLNPVIEGSNVRRAFTKRFPYAVIYRIEETEIVVVAVFHTSRNPVIWRGRIG